jgi:hypothetical protein
LALYTSEIWQPQAHSGNAPPSGLNQHASRNASSAPSSKEMPAEPRPPAPAPPTRILAAACPRRAASCASTPQHSSPQAAAAPGASCPHHSTLPCRHTL